MAAESKLEKKIRVYAEDKGCLFLKFTSPGRKGVPDRILLAPGGRVVFVELKAPTGRTSPRQGRVIQDMRDMGHDVRVIWSAVKGMELVDETTS